MDATLSTDGSHPRLRFERHLSHPVDKVWRAITEPEGLSAWFPAAVAVDGVELTFTFPDGSTSSGTVTTLTLNQRFTFVWEGETLDFTVTPTDAGTLLVFTHHFADRAGAASFAAGWDGCLAALVHTLDGSPLPVHDWAAAHERYAARFDLLRGTAEPDPDGTWRVHFERQLTAPAAAVAPRLAAITPLPATTSDTGLRAEHDGQTVHIDLSPGPGGARLRLTHAGLAEPDLVATLVHWHTAIHGLAADLMGTTPTPETDLGSRYRTATGGQLP
ncbi:uncharacterized protein YndB with AHSA1/START domain [Actinokineospora baliensis]|uniref:SRPBCC domain-containing protein n=1 Tax=Actinokineospora baliensis TaxID=547056 RepID=UPI00195825E8|nr:SRPBCC domain-containing protein [Actinokineospora baliensis]MBM7774577.1 uncharacterized protein YndB with AHSA1/START domain [Actinokineospora baliensis]